VRYAADVAGFYRDWASRNGLALQDKLVLEIGPGINFGSAILLACFGARVMVADRFLAPWHRNYHPKFYSMLLEYVHSELSEADDTPIRKILSAGRYPEDVIRCHATTLEQLDGIGDASVDLVCSVAVLEHVFDPRAAFRSLSRVSRAGALGVHQVDFRDHLTMNTPLEFLLMSDDGFARDFERRHGERGNRYRPWEYELLFRENGFEITDFHPTVHAEENYLRAFMPRLLAAGASRYRNANMEELRTVGGYYSLRKTG
jgi:SAM-dependent methyltransferase